MVWAARNFCAMYNVRAALQVRKSRIRHEFATFLNSRLAGKRACVNLFQFCAHFVHLEQSAPVGWLRFEFVQSVAQLFVVERLVAEHDLLVELDHKRGAFVPVNSHFGRL